MFIKVETANGQHMIINADSIALVAKEPLATTVTIACTAGFHVEVKTTLGDIMGQLGFGKEYHN